MFTTLIPIKFTPICIALSVLVFANVTHLHSELSLPCSLLQLLATWLKAYVLTQKTQNAVNTVLQKKSEGKGKIRLFSLVPNLIIYWPIGQCGFSWLLIDPRWGGWCCQYFSVYQGSPKVWGEKWNYIDLGVNNCASHNCFFIICIYHELLKIPHSWEGRNSISLWPAGGVMF